MNILIKGFVDFWWELAFLTELDFIYSKPPLKRVEKSESAEAKRWITTFDLDNHLQIGALKIHRCRQIEKLKNSITAWAEKHLLNNILINIGKQLLLKFA